MPDFCIEGGQLSLPEYFGFFWVILAAFSDLLAASIIPGSFVRRARGKNNFNIVLPLLRKV